MRNYIELVERLRANTYTVEELSIIIPQAADAIEELLILVDQYQQIEKHNIKAITALLKAHRATGRMTNADRIRQMSDEELAKYLGTELDGCVGRKCVIDDNTDCQKCWLNWLKQEVESDD